jgi:thiol-disulfide isomerase/thioredoxin
MPNRRTLMLATAAAAAGGGGALLWQLQDLPLAPPVTYTLLDGQVQSQTSWAGKVMLVNFWATSCATCVAKMPMLVSTHQKYRARGYDTLAVAMQYDPPDYVVQFARTRQLPFGVAIDNTGAVAQAFGPVRVTPTSFLIDRQGRVAKSFVGNIDEPALHGLIEKLL